MRKANTPIGAKNTIGPREVMGRAMRKTKRRAWQFVPVKGNPAANRPMMKASASSHRQIKIR